MDVKKWFVVTTMPRAEKKIAAKLSALGIDNYLPLCKRLRQWHDRKKYIEQPLFNNYLFIHTTEKMRNDVFKVSGIVRYLFIGGKIAIVTEKEIDRIKIFCTIANVSIQEQDFNIGDEVEIIAGQLAGVKGQLIKSTTNQKLKIHISSLGCYAIITIDRKNVRLLASIA